MARSNKRNFKQQEKENTFKQMLKHFIKKFKAIFREGPSNKKKLQQKFFDELKRNPKVFFELINRAKNKVLVDLKNIKQKLVDIKKSIAKLTIGINKIKRSIALLSGRAQKLQKELAQVKNKIKLLEKVSGKEKEIEQLKNREKEIEKTLSELAKKIELEQARMKELETEKDKLIGERNSLELLERKCQLRLNELDDNQLKFEQSMGLAPKERKPLTEILQRGREEKAREQIENTDLSYGNFAFKATLDGDFNMNYVQSQKVMPVFGWVGKETPYFVKQKMAARDDSIIAKYSVKSKFIEDRLHNAESHGFSVTPTDPKNNKEHGGRDEAR